MWWRQCAFSCEVGIAAQSSGELVVAPGWFFEAVVEEPAPVSYRSGSGGSRLRVEVEGWSNRQGDARRVLVKLS